MIICCVKMCRILNKSFDRKNMELIRDIYEFNFGIDKLVRAFDIASIVA